MTAWIVVTVVSKSSTSVLIETFMADWSSTMTNWAMASATNGNQLVFGAGSVWVTWESLAVTAGFSSAAGRLPARRAGSQRPARRPRWTSRPSRKAAVSGR